jgi:tetratricopeptide (TPR) repeat protein
VAKNVTIRKIVSGGNYMVNFVLYVVFSGDSFYEFPESKDIVDKYLNEACDMFSTKLYAQWNQRKDRWYYQLILSHRAEADKIVRRLGTLLKKGNIPYEASVEVNKSDRLDIFFDLIAEFDSPRISEVSGKEIKWDQVIVELEEVVKANPKDPNNHVNLGAAYVGKAMWDEAIAEYKRALRINSKHPLARTGLGVAYLQKGMVDKAISEHRKALAVDPNFGDAHTNLAVSYYSKKKYKLAIKHCDKAIELGHNIHPAFLEALKPYRR